jgi:predicted lipoprotein with Yx(FWY)xxD motif
MGVDVLRKRLRSSLTVVCSVAVTAALLVVGSVIRSSPDSVATAPSPAVAPAAATATAAASSDDNEAGPRPAPLIVASAPAAFGSKMVDGRGMTLYVFSLDAPGTSKCTGACARDWQPMRSSGGKPQPGTGTTAANIGSFQRPDGSDQVTFNGRPLYYYSGDAGPGQSAGHGRSAYGGRWSAAPPTKH